MKRQGLLAAFLLTLALGTAEATVCRATHTQAQATLQLKQNSEEGLWTAVKVRLDRFSISVLQIVRTLTKSTTSLRQEIKFVVDAALAMKEIDSMQAFFGAQMKNRDKARDGFRNITSTLYLTIAKYTSPNGLMKSVKLRFRRYFEQALNDPHRLNMKPAKGFEDITWMEIKIQHPWFPFVVTKLRVKIWTRDIPKMTDDSFFLYKDQVRARMLALNPKNPREVDQSLDFLTELYSSPVRKKENLFAHTEYERESYSIMVPHATKPDTFVEVQITVDQKVEATRLIDEETFNVYGPEQAVYELKIPLQYAKLTDEDIRQFPGLARIKEFKEWMEKAHDPKFPANKGKVSKVETSINAPEHDRRFLKEQITVYLEKIGWL